MLTLSVWVFFYSRRRRYMPKAFVHNLCYVLIFFFAGHSFERMMWGGVKSEVNTHRKMMTKMKMEAKWSIQLLVFCRSFDDTFANQTRQHLVNRLWTDHSAKKNNIKTSRKRKQNTPGHHLHSAFQLFYSLCNGNIYRFPMSFDVYQISFL